jgi:hypothetical protein
MQFLGLKLRGYREPVTATGGWKINLVQFVTIRTIDECVAMQLCLQLYELTYRCPNSS